MNNLISHASPDKMARMDRNLQVIRDKIEEAERVNGQTRSQLLNMLNLNAKDSEKVTENQLNDLMDLKSVKKKTGKIEINFKDLMSLQSLLDRIHVVLAGGPRKKPKTLLA